MTKVVAIKEHRYGSWRKLGDKYDVSGQDERLVKALGWVADAPPDLPEPEPEKPKRAYVRRDVAAEVAPAEPAPDEPAEPAVEAEEKPRRTYRRRDLAAES